MPQLKVLIVGAGIAGNALAFWLSKIGHDVTVVERHPELRVSGLQLDLRSHGIEVMKRMGLEQAVRAKVVNEEGMELVDSDGRSWAFFPANTTGEGSQGFTSEFEIMRGDMCQILYDVTKDRAKYVFGMSVESYDDKSDGVEVRFTDGSTDRFDLLVGADGQRSRTRRLMLGSEDAKSIDFLKTCTAYFTMPREKQEEEKWRGKAYLTTGGRVIIMRRHNIHRVQVYLMVWDDKLRAVPKGDVKAEKEVLATDFQGAGWESDEIVKAMMDADDFYCEHLGVVKLPAWSSGHVVLIGDAAHCPTPTTGLGVTASLVGAYVLAGEISNHCGRSGTKDGLSTALKAYDETFRPYMTKVQHGISSEVGWGRALWNKISATRLGILAVYWLIAAVSFLKLDRIAGSTMPGNIQGWDLPEYNEMVHGLE